MNLEEDYSSSAYHIKGYKPGELRVNDSAYSGSLILSPHELIQDWALLSIQSLSDQHIQPILALNPDIILLGTGEKLIFPDQSVLAPIYKAGVGIEIMDTAAACRTFMVLSSEGRHVVAGLVV